MFKVWERYNLKKYRWSILLMIILLCTSGIYVLDKVQGEDINMVSRQIVGLIAGVFLAFVVSMFDYHFICKLYIPLYFFNLALLTIQGL